MRKLKTNLICVLLFLSFSLQSQVYDNPGGTGIACSGTFYDTGSAGGDYGVEENITTTFCSSSGGAISVDFTSFDLEEFFDYLQIFDGEDASATAFHTAGGFTGTNGPGLVTSTGTCLTFTFISDGSVVSSGWAANISCETITCTTPPVPQNISHTLESTSRCRINWDPIPGALKYDVNYRVKGTTTWTRVAALSNEKMLRNLEENTIYQYIIRASCDGTWSFANASNKRQFNTSNAPDVVARKGTLGSNELKVSPNPARESIRVDYLMGNSSNSNLFIADMMGRIVLEKDLGIEEGKQSEDVNITSLGEGFYFLIIQSGENRMMKKFVKVK